jgi:seryl-tRNA synthetase
MTLYQIEEAILECVDMETGEIVDCEKLTELQKERDEKIQNIALWVKNLEAEAKAYKEEKDSFATKQKSAESKAENLKKFLSTYLEGQAFKSTKVNVSFRASESVNVTDIWKVPEQFLKYAEPTADKVAIKKMLKDGFTVDGAELVTNQNIQIR